MAKKKIQRQSNRTINLFVDGGSLGNTTGKANPIGAVASGVTDIFKSGLSNAQIEDTSGLENQLSANKFRPVNANTNDELMQSWGAFSPTQNVNWRNLRGGSTGQRLGNTLGATGSGAMSGFTVGGPVGAIVGGAVGLGSSIAGWITGGSKAKNKARDLNKNIDISNALALTSLENKASSLDTQSDLNRMASFSAFGGPLNIGGSAIEYELNNRYLNNKLIDIMQSKNKFDNPTNQFISGNKYKDGGGIHIKKTNRGKFTQAANRAGMGTQEFARHVMSNKEDYSPTTRKRANFVKNASKWKHEYGGNLFTDIPNIGQHGGDFSNGVTSIGNGGTHEENPNEGIPMGISPDGTPNLVEQGEVRFNNYIFSNRLFADGDLLDSVFLPKTYDGHSFADIAERLSKESSERPNDPISKRGLFDSLTKLQMAQEHIKSQEEPQEKEQFAEGGNLFANGGNASWLRYAPVLGSAIGVTTDLLGKTNTPDYTDADLIGDTVANLPSVEAEPIGNYLAYNPLDRNYYLNKLGAQAGATRRAIENQSGGNRATAMAGLLAADYGSQEQMGNLARQAEEYNLAQRERVEGFNRETNMFNTQMGLQANMANRQNDELRLRGRLAQAQLRDSERGRASMARSANLTNLFDSLGDIGRESFSREMIRSNPALYYDIDSTGKISYKNSYEDLPENEKKLVEQEAKKAKDSKKKTSTKKSNKKSKNNYITI